MASFHSLRPALPSDATDCSSITNPRIGGAKGESLVQSAVMFEHEHFVSGTVVLAPGAASGPQRTLTQTEVRPSVSAWSTCDFDDVLTGVARDTAVCRGIGTSGGDAERHQDQPCGGYAAECAMIWAMVWAIRCSVADGSWVW